MLTLEKKRPAYAPAISISIYRATRPYIAVFQADAADLESISELRRIAKRTTITSTELSGVVTVFARQDRMKDVYEQIKSSVSDGRLRGSFMVTP